MRTREQIENEAKEAGRIPNHISPFTRRDMIFLEVLLDIRDGLYENESTNGERISQ